MELTRAYAAIKPEAAVTLQQNILLTAGFIRNFGAESVSLRSLLTDIVVMSSTFMSDKYTIMWLATPNIIFDFHTLFFVQFWNKDFDKLHDGFVWWVFGLVRGLVIIWVFEIRCLIFSNNYVLMSEIFLYNRWTRVETVIYSIVIEKAVSIVFLVWFFIIL